MGVTVRLFAAVREAAGTSELTVEAAKLPDLLADLRERFGEPFARRLDLCTVLLDGSAVAHDLPVEVADGSEVVLLPPVSGGAGMHPSPRLAGWPSSPSAARSGSSPSGR